MENEPTFTVFAGERRVATGDLKTMLRKTWRYLGGERTVSVLIFDDTTGRQMEFSFRGSLDEVLARESPPPAPAGPGRPKLGVVSREVSLLPRHWDYLEAEPSGISAALRRLVEEAMKRDPGAQRARLAREAVARFMTVMAGDRPGFEEASRALFARDQVRFERLIRDWPRDVRKHVQRMAGAITDWASAGQGAV
jgi:hypothetical protein